MGLLSIADELRFKSSQELADAFEYRKRLLRRALFLLEVTQHKDGSTCQEIKAEVEKGY